MNNLNHLARSLDELALRASTLASDAATAEPSAHHGAAAGYLDLLHIAEQALTSIERWMCEAPDRAHWVAPLPARPTTVTKTTRRADLSDDAQTVIAYVNTVGETSPTKVSEALGLPYANASFSLKRAVEEGAIAKKARGLYTAKGREPIAFTEANITRAARIARIAVEEGKPPVPEVAAQLGCDKGSAIHLIHLSRSNPSEGETASA